MGEEAQKLKRRLAVELNYDDVESDEVEADNGGWGNQAPPTPKPTPLGGRWHTPKTPKPTYPPKTPKPTNPPKTPRPTEGRTKDATTNESTKDTKANKST